MESAGSHSYVSKNFIDAYLRKKQKQQTRKEESLKPKDVVPAKDFKEDAEEMMPQPQKLMSSFKAVLSRRRSRSRSNSGSDEDQERCRSVESIYKGELDGNLNLSDCGENDFDQDDDSMPQHQLQMHEGAGGEMPDKKKGEGKKFVQEVDTNVFCLNLSTLKNASEIASGDPIFCTNCNAAFNIYSRVEEEKKDEGEPCQFWKCEFCNTKNNVMVEPEEIPKTKEVNYIIEAAAQVHDKLQLGNKEVTVVFAIDTSGSMCVSKQIFGKHSIKGDRTKTLMDLMKFSDGSDQRIEGETNVTYVSRMQCVQAAIDNQISEMAKGAPDRKLGIVSFNHEVTIIGDGSKEP